MSEINGPNPFLLDHTSETIWCSKRESELKTKVT